MKNHLMWPDLTLPPINLHNMPNTTEQLVPLEKQPSLSPIAYNIVKVSIQAQLDTVDNFIQPPSDWIKGYAEALRKIKQFLIDVENIK